MPVKDSEIRGWRQDRLLEPWHARRLETIEYSVEQFTEAFHRLAYRPAYANRRFLATVGACLILAAGLDGVLWFLLSNRLFVGGLRVCELILLMVFNILYFAGLVYIGIGAIANRRMSSELLEIHMPSLGDELDYAESDLWRDLRRHVSPKSEYEHLSFDSYAVWMSKQVNEGRWRMAAARNFLLETNQVYSSAALPLRPSRMFTESNPFEDEE